MQTVVTRNVPEIVLIGANEMKFREGYLSFVHNTNLEDFVICDYWPETILVNKSLPFAEDIVPIIKQVMKQKYMNRKAENLIDQFCDIAGEKAGVVLLSIWYEWRKKVKEMELKKTAEAVLTNAKKRHISRYLRDRKDIIHTVFNIGFGLYSNDTKCNHEKGAENAFMYGYLCCMENNGIQLAGGIEK